MISTQRDLDDLVRRLSPEPRLAVDTEADSLHSYFEKLCLIQISVPGGDYLIDPLAGLDLAPLLALLESREIVIHAMDFDLRMLRRASPGFQPAAVFDTAIAAKLLGHSELGLAALLKKLLGIELCKSSQKEDWGRRPLPQKMIEYALNDTRHLLRLRDLLAAELEKLGRAEWLRQWCARSAAPAEEKPRDPETAWRVSGWITLSPRGRAILRALWNWRETEAMRRDRPPFYVLSNSELVRAADAYDKGLPFESRALKSPAASASFHKTAAEAAKLPPSAWPKLPDRPRGLKMTPDQEARINAIKASRDQIAAALRLDPSIIAPRQTVEQLVFNPRETAASLLPWQRDLLASALRQHSPEALQPPPGPQNNPLPAAAQAAT